MKKFSNKLQRFGERVLVRNSHPVSFTIFAELLEESMFIERTAVETSTMKLLADSARLRQSAERTLKQLKWIRKWT